MSARGSVQVAFIFLLIFQFGQFGVHGDNGMRGSLAAAAAAEKAGSPAFLFRYRRGFYEKLFQDDGGEKLFARSPWGKRGKRSQPEDTVHGVKRQALQKILLRYGKRDYPRVNWMNDNFAIGDCVFVPENCFMKPPPEDFFSRNVGAFFHRGKFV